MKRAPFTASIAALAGAALFALPTHAEDARDGSHDFDFNAGVWHSDITRVLDPFDSASQTLRLQGRVSVRKVWDGKAWLEEIEADGPKGHWEGMTLFLYDPKAHQWNQSFANSTVGTFGSPLIGEFRDGVGQLYSSDTFGGRNILVRGTWSQIKPDSHHYEESYSNDGGKTWKSAFIATLTREKT